MNFNKFFQKLGVSFLALSPGLFLSQLKCIASPALRQQEQQQTLQQPPPPPAQNSQPAPQQTSPIDQPAAKQKKVWTEEDVILLRTPADNYQVEKEAKEAADAQAAATKATTRTAAKPERQSASEVKLTATSEETEKMLKDTQEDIQEESVVLDKLHKELLDAPIEQQAQRQKEVDRMNLLLEKSKRDLKALQDHLQKLHEKPQEEAPAAVLPPPPAAA